MLKVFTFNKRGIAAYRKLGFKEIGRRRKALIREGSEHDVLYMDLLDEEFRNPHIKG
jgi:RimJ/RimL family protein N-acetyltransferase